MQSSGEIYQSKQQIYWLWLFLLLLWEKGQEVDMNVVSEGQGCYQLALLIVFCECKS